MAIELWVEKYRPDTLEGYIGNEKLKAKAEEYILEQSIPHLLFHAHAGGGKTTLAKILIKSIKCKHIVINASDENDVNTIRTKIKGFAQTAAKCLKIVLLDEADYLSTNSQAILRNLMEQYYKTCRFILTCNYPEKLIPALKSRCQSYKITPPTMKEVAFKAASILKNEGVTYDKQLFLNIVQDKFPDVRLVINTLQKQCIKNNDVLTLVEETEENSNNDYATNVINILADSKNTPAQKFLNCRKVISESQVKQFDELYTKLFDDVDKYSTEKIPQIMDTICNGMYQSSFVVNQEIAIMATISRIIMFLQ